MEQVKVFSTYGIDSEDLQTSINEWLMEEDVKIIRVLQSTTGVGEGRIYYITLTIFYKEK